MNIQNHKHLILLAAVTLAVGGCSSTPSQDGSSTSSDQTQTRVEGTAAGAVIGGLLGYAIGGGGKGAAIGAAIGGGTGYLIGNDVAKRKAAYVSQEDFLDAEIASAQEFNRSTAQYNGQLRGEIVQLEQQSNLLESRYRAGLVTRDALDESRQQVQAKISRTDKVYANLKKEYEVKLAIYDDQKQQGSDAGRVQQLQAEITGLKGNLDQLQSQSVQLAQIEDRLTL